MDDKDQLKFPDNNGHIDIAWRRLMDYCQHELRHGEIKLQVQNGLPVVAEYVRKRIKFVD